VSKEALQMIFAGADATGFEEDARLTAMWFWTLNTKDEGGRMKDEEEDGSSDASDDEDEEAGTSKAAKMKGYTLEFDAARRIAQGLGAHLEGLAHLIEVKGDKARLLPVAERTKYLFGKEETAAASAKRQKKKAQGNLFAELEEAEADAGGWGVQSAPHLGNTVLDRVHQSMILFAAGRGEALRRFLVDDGAGHDERFWRLANALSALYPTGSEEKRWVDGMLARKKGLGF
jgi:putative DNA methylase